MSSSHSNRLVLQSAKTVPPFPGKYAIIWNSKDPVLLGVLSTLAFTGIPVTSLFSVKNALQSEANDAPPAANAIIIVLILRKSIVHALIIPHTSATDALTVRNAPLKNAFTMHALRMMNTEVSSLNPEAVFPTARRRSFVWMRSFPLSFSKDSPSTISVPTTQIS